jgi:hypothetical protein
MKRILLCIIFVAFTLGESEAVNGKQLPSPPPAPGKKRVKTMKPRKLSRKGAATLQKKAEQTAKLHQVEMQRREFLLMQEAQRRGMIQRQQMQQQQNSPQ